MKAHDVRHLRVCAHCGEIGDNRKMLQINGAPWHDACAVATMSEGQILRLPAAERGKITLGAAGVPLMRKLMGARHLSLAR
jgi:hypothetical protein